MMAEVVQSISASSKQGVLWCRSQIVCKPCAPSTLTTPALGLDLVILDEDDHPAHKGEVFIIPPSIGLMIVDALPRTASNKVMRHVLHNQYRALAPISTLEVRPST
ncbi:MAG: hypothetical protein HC769_14175 [Cyanobacteria bacterium CRU_2_1]|nr:hypothetical protein [Cyanobacteria bacterium CRU_2_1]